MKSTVMWNLPLRTPTFAAADDDDVSLLVSFILHILRTFQYLSSDVIGRRSTISFLDLARDFRFAGVLLIEARGIHRAGEGDVDVDSIEHEFRVQSLCKSWSRPSLE